MTQTPLVIHRVQATLFPVNAYLIESPTEIVAVDATLGQSDGRRLRQRAEQSGKPLAGVVVTHAHPDHYGALGALVEGLDVPIYAVGGVIDIIRRDDAEKERILRPMFADEWALTRTFPTHPVRGGDRVSIGNTSLRALDVGPGESPHDSWWVLETAGRTCVFAGDLFYNHMHAYLADGFAEQWLANLARATRELPADVEFYVGHGDPVQGFGILDWQAGYINEFLAAVGAAAGDGLRGDVLVEAVAKRMKAYLPAADLEFLMRLSVEPARARLAAR